MIITEDLPGGITLPMDKGYDYHAFIAELPHMAVTPHVMQNTTTRRSGSNVGRRDIPAMRSVNANGSSSRKLKPLHVPRPSVLAGSCGTRGGRLVTWIFTFSATVDNIVRLRGLLSAFAS